MIKTRSVDQSSIVKGDASAGAKVIQGHSDKPIVISYADEDRIYTWMYMKLGVEI